jgi:hypothetical protein
VCDGLRGERISLVQNFSSRRAGEPTLETENSRLLIVEKLFPIGAVIGNLFDFPKVFLLNVRLGGAKPAFVFTLQQQELVLVVGNDVPNVEIALYLSFIVIDVDYIHKNELPENGKTLRRNF